MFDIKDAYNTMLMKKKDYFLKRVLPSILVGCSISASLFFLLPQMFAVYPFSLQLYIIPLFILVAVLLYPLADYQSRAVKINQEMHIFITQLGALSVSEMSESGFLDILKELEMKGEIKKEMNKLTFLVDEWNVPLSNASRIISEKTPSDMFSDFLERLAYALETQASPKEFFLDEQKTFIDSYKNEYDNMLFRLDLIKELYVATITIAVFSITIAIVVPVVLDISAVFTVSLTVGLYFIITALFLWAFFQGLPQTQIWCDEDMDTSLKNKLRNPLFFGASSSILVFFLLFNIASSLSLMDITSISLIPLAIPAYMAYSRQKDILRRDDAFPSFLRSMASNMPSRTMDPIKALDKLRFHSFSNLSDNISSLYERLKLKIDTTLSWKHFGAESGSFLINRFTHMYLKASKEGAKPEESAPIISDNFILMKGLREKKLLRGRSMIGILIATIAAITVVLVSSFEIIYHITSVLHDVELTAEVGFPIPFEGILHPAAVNLSAFRFMTFIIILTQAAASAIISWHVTGEHKAISLGKFALFFWVATITYYATSWAISLIFEF